MVAADCPSTTIWEKAGDIVVYCYHWQHVKIYNQRKVANSEPALSTASFTPGTSRGAARRFAGDGWPIKTRSFVLTTYWGAETLDTAMLHRCCVDVEKYHQIKGMCDKYFQLSVFLQARGQYLCLVKRCR